MFPLALLVVAVHVLADCVWVGALISSLYLARPQADADLSAQRARAATALEIHGRVAGPARWVALAFGLYRFIDGMSGYAHAPWMHAKLTLGLLLFGLHDVAGAKLRKFASGAKEQGPAPWMLWAAFALASAIVLLAVLKNFLL